MNMDKLKILAKGLFALALLVHASASQAQASEEKQHLARFEKQVDELRGRLRIPGMSAAIIKDQKVVWAKGFGFADAELRRTRTRSSPYRYAILRRHATSEHTLLGTRIPSRPRASGPCRRSTFFQWHLAARSRSVDAVQGAEEDGRSQGPASSPCPLGVHSGEASGHANHSRQPQADHRVSRT